MPDTVQRPEPPDAVVDRPPHEAAVSASAAWLAFMIGLMVGGEVEDAESFAVAAIGGAVLVFAGFAAASRCRVLPRFAGGQRVRLALLSLAAGLVLGADHLDRPLPADPALANYYRAALLAKYTLAGLPLGWIFWHWGLPYAIVCHIAANAAHLALQQRFF